MYFSCVSCLILLCLLDQCISNMSSCQSKCKFFTLIFKRYPFAELCILNTLELMLFFQWLWASIQMEARADESMYLFEEETENSQCNSRSSSCRKTPSSVTSSGKSRSHRRKRLRENLAKLAHEGQGDTPLVKTRRSSYSIACQPLSTSQNDNTASELSTTVIGNVAEYNFLL